MEKELKNFLLSLSKMDEEKINSSTESIIKKANTFSAESLNEIILDDINFELLFILEAYSSFSGSVNLLTYLTFFTEMNKDNINSIKKNIDLKEYDKDLQNDIAKINLSALLCGQNCIQKIQNAIDLQFDIYDLHSEHNILKEFLKYKSMYSNYENLKDLSFIVDNIPEAEKYDFRHIIVKPPHFMNNLSAPYSILSHILHNINYPVSTILAEKLLPYLTEKDNEKIIEIVSQNLYYDRVFDDFEKSKTVPYCKNINLIIKYCQALNPKPYGNHNNSFYLMAVLERFYSKAELKQVFNEHCDKIDFKSCFRGYLRNFFSDNDYDITKNNNYKNHLSEHDYIDCIKETITEFAEDKGIFAFKHIFMSDIIQAEKDIISQEISQQTEPKKIKRL